MTIKCAAECSTYLDINESGNIEENRAEHDRNEVAAKVAPSRSCANVNSVLMR